MATESDHGSKRRSRERVSPCVVHMGAGSAFSLIELLIAVAIVVILYAMYLTAGSQKAKTKQKIACQKNLQNAYIALKTHSLGNTNQFPFLSDASTAEAPLGLLIPRSTTVTEYFICPGTKDKVPPAAKPFGKSRISYGYYMGRTALQGPLTPLMSDEQVNTNAKAPGQALFSADGKGLGSNHDQYGGVILFCDGSTQISGTNTSKALPLGQGVTFLNPKP